MKKLILVASSLLLVYSFNSCSGCVKQTTEKGVEMAGSAAEGTVNAAGTVVDGAGRGIR